MKSLRILFALFALAVSFSLAAQPVFLEAEAFDRCGGWVNDNRSVSQMGSPYMLAHGLGVPVPDAYTDIHVSQPGQYRLWVRTRDWTRSWGRTESPGRFQVLVNGKAADVVFGTESAEWAWQDGGIISLSKGSNRISLHDLTGFDGRCDALFLTPSLEAPAPVATDAFRRKMTGKRRPSQGGSYDFVVVGGGIAGCCAAITAARLGCKVALIQDRPVLGGNHSSEIRVGLSGRIFQEPYPKLGSLMDEIARFGYHNRTEARENPDSPRSKKIIEELKAHPEQTIHNAGPAKNYDDGRKLDLILSEPNITLFLNQQVIAVRKKGSRIRSVIARDISSGNEVEIRGNLFSDCTGDAELGYLAGADWRMGRESRAETGEPRAPEQADMLTMGTSVQWYAVDAGHPTLFPECPWALPFSDSTCIPKLRGDWDWETGLGRDQIAESEYIRDLGFRAAFGNWSYLKNHTPYKEKFATKSLGWVAAIGGKRESRRLLGDVILKEQDLLEHVLYEDATFTTTWGVDLHFPKPEPGMPGEEPFRAKSIGPGIQPFAVPYRCLYSRNIDNLMMAGRDISVTHVALGTVRVMRTGGMMGEVVGMAASLCRQHRCQPRAIYTDHLEELKSLMSAGVPPATEPVPPYSRSLADRTPRGYVNPDNKKEWKMVWQDEFDYQTREQLLKVWQSSNGPTSHTGCSRWEENLEVGDGTVRLVNRKENRGGQEWTSADVGTYRDFKYGYFECRYKYAAAAGINNSFWIWTRDPRWKPEEGRPFEIDINEGHYPSEYTNNVHEWMGTMTLMKLISADGGATTYPDIDFSQEYHLFGVDWEEDEIIFYLDRKETRRVKNEFCHSAAPVRLSAAVLRSAKNHADAADGTFMEVDYVRVYARR